jgi:hypothetical protein
VRLLGYICKIRKNCDDVVVAPTKKTSEREKRHDAVCDIAALNKISKKLR